MHNPHQIYCFENTVSLARSATQAILTAAQQTIAKKGAFKIVLAGGNSPNTVYQLLSQAETDWSKWWIFWGDERCLPVDDPDRNSRMAKQVWLDKVAIPRMQIFPISAEQGAKAGADDYKAVISQYLPFDMVLLGMGEDGHIASLFPEQIHDENALVHEIYHAPKPPANRVSLSAIALSNSTNVLFLIHGAGKLEAFKAWQHGADLPTAKITPQNGIEIYADNSALGLD